MEANSTLRVEGSLSPPASRFFIVSLTRNESTRSEAVLRAIVYSVRIGPPQAIFDDLERLGPPSEPLLSSPTDSRFPRMSFCQTKGLEIVTLPICCPS